MDLGTYADGRAISYDEQSGVLDVGGTPVAPELLREYDNAGQVSWAEANNRAWLDASFPPVAATKPSAGRKKIPVLLVVIGVVLLCGMCSFVARLAPSSTTTPPVPTAQEAAPTPAPAPAAEATEAQAPEEPVVEEPAEPAAEEPTVEEPAEPALSVGKQQAVDKAQDYLDMGGFSRKSLIAQLRYEGFSKSEAIFAVDYIKPNWNKQAAQKARSYMDVGGFSRKSLTAQLRYEGFTSAQTRYGVKSVGY